MKRAYATLFSLLLAVFISVGGTASALTKNTKAKPKVPVRKPTAIKGHGQLVGGIGRFGEIYTLRSGFNFSILGARYSVEPLGTYSYTSPRADEKLLIINCAVKNANKSDDWFGSGGGFITAVDSKGGLYESSDGSFSLKSAGPKTKIELRPGQGMGQPALNDPLCMAIVVPGEARIVKIIVNQPRLNITEEVFRYYIAGATKAEAGEDGDPKNPVAPLPEPLRDPSDPTGATALSEGRGVLGTATCDWASGDLRFRVNSLTYSTEDCNSRSPEDGKQWAVANVTISFPHPSGKAADYKEVTKYYWVGTGAGFAELLDADGDKYPALDYGTRKQTRDEPLADGSSLTPGGEYTYRIFFPVPKDVKLKKLTLGVSNGRKWAFAVK